MPDKSDEKPSLYYGKRRPGIGLRPDLYDWWDKKYSERGAKSKWFEAKVQEEKDRDESDPVEARRRKVVRELREVTDQLNGIRQKLKLADSRERRLGKISGLLLQAYPGLGRHEGGKWMADWDEIRLRATEEFDDDPEWSKRLQIKDSLEIDEACDQAQEISHLEKREEELSTENKSLRKRAAEKNHNEVAA